MVREALDVDQDDERLISADSSQAECRLGRLQQCFQQAGEEKSFESVCVLQGEESTVQCRGARGAVYELQAG